MLLPTNFLTGVGLVGAILLATRLASLGRKLVIASVVLLAICGFSPLGKWLLYPLESRFPPWGGAGVASAADELIAAAALPRRYPKARIIFTGGSANLMFGDAREADYATALFESLGVSRERLTMERGARNTQENAE